MKIEYSKRSYKALLRMDTTTKHRICKGILEIPKGDIKPLKGSLNTYRLRVGDWRILFSYSDNDTIIIEKIAPRGGVYKEV